MKPRPLAAVATAVLLLIGCADTQAQQNRAAERSLYQRLGGYDAIAAVTDDFIARLAGDAQFARFFGGLSTDSKLHLRQMVVEQLCAASGGPCVYVGRTMKASHAGLGITEREWSDAAAHLVASMDRYKVAKGEKDQVIAFVSTLKPDIVEKK